MIAKLPKRVSNKYWVGEERPQFLVGLDETLREYGFSFIDHDNNAPASLWQRGIFCEHKVGFTVFPRLTRKNPKGAGIDFSFSVTSLRQGAVFRELDFIDDHWISEFGGEDALSSFEDVHLMSVSFNWLISAWSGGSLSMREAFGMWEDVNADNIEEKLTLFRTKFSEIGGRFLGLVDAPEKLAALLANLQGLASHVGGSGPVSASPLEFALVIYRDIGRLDKATELLNELERKLPTSLGAGNLRFADPRAEARAKLGKYRRWLQNET